MIPFSTVHTRDKIRGIIAKLEGQRSELKDVISGLRDTGQMSPQGVHDLSLDDHEK
jgi:hypothetical protein